LFTLKSNLDLVVKEFCRSVSWYLCQSLQKAVGGWESTMYTDILDESAAWELKPGYCSRFEQTYLNNATISYQSKCYCAPYVLLPLQITSWKAWVSQ